VVDECVVRLVDVCCWWLVGVMLVCNVECSICVVSVVL
jgi:hypothetical protein